jgi:serine/threonine-protein kinase
MMPTETDAPPSNGLVGGKYQLVKLIGRGGMGSVWEARHANLGTPVAIKFIEAEHAKSAEARSRFDKEAKAAATILSKHAIQIYDNGVTDEGKPYIVMELLQGEPLDKRIDRLGRLSLQDTARILQHVCRGLSKAHERGIVHRDLKPENIFLVHNTDDDDEIAKVLDFGIAKVQSSPHNPGITSSTKTGAVLGTPFYMSPEQARGLRSVDFRTDIWSLGVIAFKCVTGQLPFDGESVGDLLVKICTSPVPQPSHIVPGLPAGFDSWFLRALERDPDRRFSNVTELSEHLAFIAGIAVRGPLSNPQQQRPSYGDPVATVAGQERQRGAVPTPPRGNAAPAYTPVSDRPARTASMTGAGLSASAPFTATSHQRHRAAWFVGAALVGLLLAGIGVAALKLGHAPTPSPIVMLPSAGNKPATAQSERTSTTTPVLPPEPALPIVVPQSGNAAVKQTASAKPVAPKLSGTHALAPSASASVVAPPLPPLTSAIPTTPKKPPKYDPGY